MLIMLMTLMMLLVLTMLFPLKAGATAQRPRGAGR